MLALRTLCACVLTFASASETFLVKRADGDDNDESYIYANLTSENDLYYINLEVGSNKQQLFVVVDTGSADLWFPSVSECKTRNCTNDDFFNTSASTSFHPNQTTFQVTGSNDIVASGYYAQDSINVLGKEIEYANFAISNSTNETSGYLGLAYPALESANLTDGNIYPNFLTQLVENKYIHRPAYSLYFGYESPSILFGAIDTGKVNGELTQFDIVHINQEYFTKIALSMNHLNYDGTEGLQSIGDGYYPVVLGSGTDYSMIPADFVDSVGSIITLEFDEDADEAIGGVYYVQCSSIQEGELIFAFQQVEFSVPIASFFRESDKREGQCYLNAIVTKDGYIELGTSILQYFYIIVDLEDNKVGLGEAAENPSHEEIHIIKDSIGDLIYPPTKDVYGKDGHDSFGFFDNQVVNTPSNSSTTTSSGSISSATSVSSSSSRNDASVLFVSNLSYGALILALLM